MCRLHWDFRLEHGGILWSWAAPHGPSLDPHDKRLAVHVEDHPIDYADFHGTIPVGQYGAGTVETWDRGTWEPVGSDPAADLARGELKFVIHGKRLEGKFVLIRLEPRPNEKIESLLLIKKHDAHEHQGIDAAAIEASVPAPSPRGKLATPKQTDKILVPAPGAVLGRMPADQVPQLATLTETAPDAAHADRLVFDPDPGDGIFMTELAAAAHDVKSRLAQIGLAAFARTSGDKGLHIVCPVRDTPDWDSVRAWCRKFAETMVADSPALYVAAVKKSIRDGKILIDWLRNGQGSTAVASFSPRARPGAGVATPLAWREVTAKLDPATLTLKTVPARLAKQKTDPWAGFAEAARPLPKV